MKILNDLIHPIIDFIYPPVCCICEKLTVREELPVCSHCWKTFTTVSPSHPTWIEIKSKFTSGGNVSDILSCYLFEPDGKLQEVIHCLKYKEMKSLGIRLGNDIGCALTANPEFSRADYLIPVPLHSCKKRERGYNQSELICAGIRQKFPMPVLFSVIQRIRNTQSQTELTLEERILNVENAFEMRKKIRYFVKGKIFIIVDDVITTGSTINACAEELISHGAQKVLAVSAALAR